MKEQLIQSIVDAGRFLYGRGWSPATSSNYSCRLNDSEVLVTVSGKHKGQLTMDDVMRVDYLGKPLDDKRPSAETLLHTQLYQWREDIGAVLHTHSVQATVLSQLHTGSQLELSDYELLKAFEGISTHATSVVIPIFDNTQDMPALARQVETYLHEHPATPGYLIRGHGLYTWASDMPACLRQVEAFEFLFECELLKKRIAP